MNPDLELITSGGLFNEMGKVATRHPSPEKGMLWWGFLLRQSFGVVPERRRLCLSEERLPSSGSVKVLLGIGVVLASPKADVISSIDSATASSSPVMPVASIT